LIVSDPLTDFTKPTFAAAQALLDNYQKDVTVQDEFTAQQLAEELAFIDAVMETSVMQQLHAFLVSKGIFFFSIFVFLFKFQNVIIYTTFVEYR
jgi:poly(U)-specific endoribonuclease